MRPPNGWLLVAAAIVAVTLSACTSSDRTTAPTSTPAGSHVSYPTAPNGSPGGKITRPNYRAQLSRPLHFPVLRPGQACPISGGTAISGHGFTGVGQGSGPVHPLAGDTNGVADLTSTNHAPGWLAIKSLWFSEPRYQGPFLVRIRRLDGAGPAGLLEDPALTSFYVPPGPTASGTDGYRVVTGATWVKTPGCVAWRADGLTFSKVIVMRLVCRPPACTMAHTTASRAQAAEAEHLVGADRVGVGR